MWLKLTLIVTLIGLEWLDPCQAVGFTQDIMTEGLYEEPSWEELGDEDSEGDMIRVKAGMFGYQCKTEACANEPRPGIPWPSKCTVKRSKLQHYCVPFSVAPDMGKY